MVYLQTKNTYFGLLWKTLELKFMPVYSMTLWLSYVYSVYFIPIGYIFWIFGIFSRFGMPYREKSGSPAYKAKDLKCSKTEASDRPSFFLLRLTRKSFITEEDSDFKWRPPSRRWLEELLMPFAILLSRNYMSVEQLS
jgi:hypothetical protein